MREQIKSKFVAGRRDGSASIAPIGQTHRWLDHAPTVFCVIACYLILHFLVRLFLSPTLGIDDAEQILFAQQWAPGYRFRQPPLFTWLLLPVVDWTGPGVLAVSIVRYSLLALTYGFLYLTALQWIDDRRLAALSVFSFTLIYVFAYYAHHDLTHTTALAAMIAATLYTFSKLSQQPTVPLYLMLGICFGLGMLAKWNFVILALGLPLTCLMHASYRRLVLNPKCFLTLVVSALIVSPTAFWMFSHGQSTGQVSNEILNGRQDFNWLELMTQGSSALLTSLVLFPLPFLLIFLVIFGPILIQRHSAPLTGSGTDPRFLGWLMVVLLGLLALLVPLFGAVNFTERWMHPALMPLPLFLFATLAQRKLGHRKISFYLGVIAILVAVAIGARLYRYIEGADGCGKCREFAPFTTLATDLRANGFNVGTIVADGMHMGGNLKVAFPESRIIDPNFPLALWPVSNDRNDDQGMCLLIWRDDLPNAKARQDKIRHFAQNELDLPATSARKSGRVEARLLRSSDRQYALGFELIRENVGGCR